MRRPWMPLAGGSRRAGRVGRQDPKRKPVAGVKKAQAKLAQVRRDCSDRPAVEQYETLKLIESLLAPVCVAGAKESVDYSHIRAFATAARHYVAGARREYEQLLFGGKSHARLLKELENS